MSLQRKMSWNAALRDLRDDRGPRALIRTERMRSIGLALVGAPMLAWRGLSGARYLCTVHGIDAAAPGVPAVVIAARPIATGHDPISARVTGSEDHAFAAWRAAARAAGATEFHVFDPSYAPSITSSLAEIAADLTPDPVPARAAA